MNLKQTILDLKKCRADLEILLPRLEGRYQGKAQFLIDISNSEHLTNGLAACIVEEMKSLLISIEDLSEDKDGTLFCPMDRLLSRVRF